MSRAMGQDDIEMEVFTIVRAFWSRLTTRTLEPNNRLQRDLHFDDLDLANLRVQLKRSFAWLQMPMWQVTLDMSIEDITAYVEEKKSNPDKVRPLVLGPVTVTSTQTHAQVPKTKSILMFPGQGAQKVGMGRRLMETAQCKQIFDNASKLLGWDVADLCLNGPEEKLVSTKYCQPAIFVSSLAALEQLKQTRPEILNGCMACLGLSIGEFTALTFSGALSFEDGLKLVAKRAEIMEGELETGVTGMVSVFGVTLKDLEAISSGLEVANLLGPKQFVLAGTMESCETLMEEGPKTFPSAKFVKLRIAAAFHSSFMSKANEKFSKLVDDIEIQTPKLPIVMNVDGHAHTDPAVIKDNVKKQMSSSVQWDKSFASIAKEMPGVQVVVEVGVGSVLSGLLRRMGHISPLPDISSTSI